MTLKLFAGISKTPAIGSVLFRKEEQLSFLLNNSQITFMSKPISLAQIRRENLIRRGILKEEDFTRKTEQAKITDQAARAEASRFTSTVAVMRGKEEARNILRARWLRTRSTGTVHTVSDFSAAKDSEGGAFLLEAAKTNPSVISPSEKIGREALRLTNEYRESKHLPPCLWDSAVYAVCVKHSQQIAEGKKGFDHSGFSQRVRSLPFPSSNSGENLFQTDMDGAIAQIAVDGWIHSPGHEKNLVGHYTHCAIGSYTNSQGKTVLTQIFVHK